MHLLSKNDGWYTHDGVFEEFGGSKRILAWKVFKSQLNVITSNLSMLPLCIHGYYNLFVAQCYCHLFALKENHVFYDAI